MANATAAKATDFTVQNEGSIFLLQPLTASAREWVSGNISDEHQTFGSAVVVEHRFIMDIVDGIQAAGLSVR